MCSIFTGVTLHWAVRHSCRRISVSPRWLLPATVSTVMSRLRQICRRVGREPTISLVLAVIIFRIDYCNSALADLQQTTIAPLQLTRAVTSTLLQLYWLPVRCRRIRFNLCYITVTVQYSLLLPVDHVLVFGHQFSDDALARLRTKFNERAFSCADPPAWNALAKDIRAMTDYTTKCSNLMCGITLGYTRSDIKQAGWWVIS